MNAIVGTQFPRKHRIRTRVKLSVLAAALLLAGSAAVFSLVWHGTPSPASTLDFQGFIELPSTRRLNVLDYLTLRGRQLFVTNESSGSVYRVTLTADENPTGATVASMDGQPAPHGVALPRGGEIAYVTRSEANAVDVFDPRTMVRTGSIRVPEDADAILYDTASDLIYVAHGDAHVATLIDPKQQRVIGAIQLGGKPEFPVLDSRTHLVYQNLQDTNRVGVVDLSKRQVIDRWPLEGCDGPTGMALDGASQRLFIGCNHNAKLVVFDLISHRVVATFSIGGGPDSVAFDAALHRIYVTGKSGMLTVIEQQDPNTYRIIDQVHLHYGAHTLALDPATHTLFVGYASLFTSPRIAVFTARQGPLLR
jgi:DNA-binding beta-propeller fold protein YncE